MARKTKDDALLKKLAKRKGITDPKGLAAWIKKHKKEDEDSSLYEKLQERDTRAMGAYKAGRRAERVARGKQGFVSGQDPRERGVKKVRAPNLGKSARTSKQARGQNKARWKEAPGTGHSAFRRTYHGGAGSRPSRGDVEKAVSQSKRARKASAYSESLLDKLVDEGLLDESPIFTSAASAGRRAARRRQRPPMNPRPRPRPKKKKEGDKKSLWGKVKSVFGAQAEETITKRGDPRQALQRQALKLMKKDARLRKMAAKEQRKCK